MAWHGLAAGDKERRRSWPSWSVGGLVAGFWLAACWLHPCLRPFALPPPRACNFAVDEMRPARTTPNPATQLRPILAALFFLSRVRQRRRADRGIHSLRLYGVPIRSTTE